MGWDGCTDVPPNQALKRRADITVEVTVIRIPYCKPVPSTSCPNLWATWCAPCKVEMPELDWLSTRYESQGLVVLSITLEDEAKVRQFASSQKYHPAVLIDQGGKVTKQFHIEEIPKTFVYGRDGELIAVGIDQHTRKQFLRMLSNTDLRP
jgi:thiol-disulfide isomerase/thioredoxin